MAWLVIAMTLSGPITLFRADSREDCELLAEEHGAKCVVGVPVK